MGVTLQELRVRARERADMVGSKFISDSELDSYLNAGYFELYDILVSRWEDYYTQEASVTVAGGASSCALPTDFYKLVALDKGDTEVKKFAFKERHNVVELSYRIVKDSLVFLPAEVAAGAYTLWYVPVAERLAVATTPPTAGTTDVINDVNGWSEFVVVSAGIMMLQKEESDIQPLLIEKRALLERIEAMASNRDASAPESITEVWSSYDESFRISTT